MTPIVHMPLESDDVDIIKAGVLNRALIIIIIIIIIVIIIDFFGDILACKLVHTDFKQVIFKLAPFASLERERFIVVFPNFLEVNFEIIYLVFIEKCLILIVTKTNSRESLVLHNAY